MKALFRCDATAAIGFGHLSRCIALAEGLELYGTDSAFAGQFDPAAIQMIADSGFAHVELSRPVNSEDAARELAGIAGARDADFLVLDSYRIDSQYLSNLKEAGVATVLFDDFCALDDYPCSVVLNFTWEAAQFDYPEGPKLLLGPNHLPARRKLVALREQSIVKDRSGEAANILVAIGGSDPKGITARVLRMLGDVGIHACVQVIGAQGDELAALLGALGEGSRLLTRQPDLSEPLLWADAAITGGGLIKYESAFMGVPAAAIAQNSGQDGETQMLAAAGLVFDLGLADSVSDQQLSSALRHFLSSAELRSDMAKRMGETFVPDPSAHAAKAILECLER